MLEGLLDYFFPPSVSAQYNHDDIHWFLEEISSKKCIFRRAFLSTNAQKTFLKFYLIRILSIANDQAAEDNRLVVFNNDVSNYITIIIL